MDEVYDNNLHTSYTALSHIVSDLIRNQSPRCVYTFLEIFPKII